MKRLRILLSAYYFSPYRGSESAVGWNVATELAKYHDVTVLCGDLNPEGTTGQHLKEYEKKNSYPMGLTVHYVLADETTQRLHDLHSKPGLWFLYYKAYNSWQKKAYEEAEILHRESAFDIIHHLNIIGYREPGYLWKINAPFLWGPISGASMIPLSFFGILGWKGIIRNSVRNVVNGLQMRGLLRCRKAARKSSQIWVVSDDDKKMVKDIWHCDASSMLEIAADSHGLGCVKKRLSGEKLIVVWSAIHQSAKALPLLLRAIARLEDRVNIKLIILGAGASTSKWHALAEQLKINDKVEWTGMLSREDALEKMKRSHVLANTSLKEATGVVNLEALSLGLPVICHDACGMGIAINEHCGIKVPLKNPEMSIEGFKKAIQSLLENPDLLSKLSEGALLRAQELSWDKKVRLIAQTYADVTAQYSS